MAAKSENMAVDTAITSAPLVAGTVEDDLEPPKGVATEGILDGSTLGVAATQGADHEAVGRRFGKCCVAEAHVDGGFIDVVDRDGLAVATAGMTVRDRNV